MLIPISKVLRAIFRPAFYFFLHTFQKDAFRHYQRDVIVIHIQETGLQEHVEPIIQRLIQENRFLIVVVLRENQLEAYKAKMSLCMTNPHFFVFSEKSFLRLNCHPQFILSLHPESPSLIARHHKNACKVVMQHGLPDKETFFVPDGRGDTLKYYNGIFLYGPYSRQGTLKIFAEKYPATFRKLRIFEIGYPKTDALLAPFPQKREFLTNLGLNPDKPTVCYGPTYQKEASLQVSGVEIVRTLAGLDVNVIVKLHHVSLKSPTSAGLEPWVIAETEGKDWKQIMDSLERQFPNVKLAKEQNANPYLMASDLLVTDVSGVAFEFLLLDRPIVFFDVPELFAKYGRVGIHYTGRECGDIVSNLRELGMAITKNLSDPSLNFPKRQKWIEHLVYNKGHATEIACQTIWELAQAK